MLLPQQVLPLVMQGTEELPAGPTVQVIVLIALWTERAPGEQGGGTGILPSPNISVKVFVAQLCLTLWDPVDCRPPGSSVHGILQARILEWVANPFPGDLPNPGIESRSFAWQEDSLLTELSGKPQW